MGDWSWDRNPASSRVRAVAVGYIHRALKADRVQRSLGREDRDWGRNIHPGDAAAGADPECAVTILICTERSRIDQAVGNVEDLRSLPSCIRMGPRPPLSVVTHRLPSRSSVDVYSLCAFR